MRYLIIDTGPAFAWSRETILTADSRDAAQEAYIDQCDADGVAHGTLHISRTR